MNSSAARIGYARVSTADQNLDAQIAALQAARCTMVRTETGDGATIAGRPELQTILDFIHPRETLVVTRIDRLARSMRDLQVIVATLKDKGAHLAATEQPVDTSTAAGKPTAPAPSPRGSPQTARLGSSLCPPRTGPFDHSALNPRKAAPVYRLLCLFVALCSILRS